MIHTEDKPPLTRRWTPHCLILLSHSSQTSAHAEMDLSRINKKIICRANLRSRGDGPHIAVISILTQCKPPLTRRWTLPALIDPLEVEQTSAHAEMDPPPFSWRGTRSPNLRSRGDGPTPYAIWLHESPKPPLTRRWTCRRRRRKRPAAQTSAHAEMDPWVL